MESWSPIFILTVPIIVVIGTTISRIIKLIISSSWYKRKYAERQQRWTELTALVFEPLKRKLFAHLDENLKRLNGDVLEIGIGSGQNFHHYPTGTALIAVDPNPHVEKLLKENLRKEGDRIKLKRFVAVSAEDMSYKERIGVEDNAVAAVVCTKLFCSLTDDQAKKVVREVKRVLIPVSIKYISILSTRVKKSLDGCNVRWGQGEGGGVGGGS